MDNPYTPGYDKIPPFLAGRDEDLRRLSPLISDLSKKSTHTWDVVIFGPRGNGKSTLVNVIANIAKKEGIRVLNLTSSQVLNLQGLCTSLFEQSIPDSQFSGHIKSGSVGIGGTKFSLEQQTKSEYKTDVAMVLQLARKYWSSSSTLLTVDEAHRIPQITLDALNALVREGKLGGSPFNFILAGPPKLLNHLNSLDSTFLNRVRKLRLDRLNLSDAALALFRPLQDGGFKIDLNKQERERIVAKTQGYPHFVQCIGYAIWDSVVSLGQKEISKDVLTTASLQYQEWIDSMYEDRQLELSRLGITDVAIELAKLFSRRDSPILESDIRAAIESAGDKSSIEETMKNLLELGYIWNIKGNATAFEPGIPSLMDHVLKSKTLS